MRPEFRKKRLGARVERVLNMYNEWVRADGPPAMPYRSYERHNLQLTQWRKDHEQQVRNIMIGFAVDREALIERLWGEYHQFANEIPELWLTRSRTWRASTSNAQ